MGTTGVIATVAAMGGVGSSGEGGRATTGQLTLPSGVAVDSAGNLYIADTFHSAIRKVATNGIITTVAGNGSPGYSGDGGLSTSAQLNHPYNIGLDSAGNLYVADTGIACIRQVKPS